jgi:hypothetical protein
MAASVEKRQCKPTSLPHKQSEVVLILGAIFEIATVPLIIE